MKPKPSFESDITMVRTAGDLSRGLLRQPFERQIDIRHRPKRRPDPDDVGGFQRRDPRKRKST